MPSDSPEKYGGAARPTASNPPPKLDEPLPCPRCDSRTTKFCYYNNYNLSQPRYFCKSCRRYWTHGGTLRNVPVGGGSRKSTKRARPATTSPSPPVATPNASSFSSPLTTTQESEIVAVTAAPVSVVPVSETKPEMGLGHVNLNESFDSFMNPQGHGYLSLGGYGLDSFWGYSGGGFLSGGGAIGGTPVFNWWQASGDVDGGGGLVDSDSFAWPGLAISTHGKALK